MGQYYEQEGQYEAPAMDEMRNNGCQKTVGTVGWREVILRVALIERRHQCGGL